jgi:hypothetical protein
VNETLVITPLAVTDDANPVLRDQQALKDLSQTDVETLAQAEVLAGVKEWRAHFIIHPQDGLKTDNDKGMVLYCRMHTKECTVVHTLTDKARDAIFAEAAHKAQEAQAVHAKPPDGEEKLPPDEQVGDQQPPGGDGKPIAKPPDNDEGKPPDNNGANKPPEGNHQETTQPKKKKLKRSGRPRKYWNKTARTST